MKILFKQKFLLAVFLLLFFIIKNQSWATTFPIKELSNCQSQKECHLYCEIPQNKPACWAWKVYSNNVLPATTTEAKLGDLKLTFPIPELNNCADLISCKEFCAKLENATACKKFSQFKNIELSKEILKKAQENLGCNTWDECRKFCELNQNQDICRNFTQKYQLKNPVKNDILNYATKELGCKSLSQCKDYCLKNENLIKCYEFAKKYAQLLLNKTKTDTSCQTNKDCQKKCEENPKNCPNYPKNSNQPILASPNLPSSKTTTPSKNP